MKLKRGNDGILRDEYGREFEMDETVLRTKKGKRKYVGKRTLPVKLKRLAESQQDLDAEYKAIVDKNFWELLGK